ncbi:MAG: tRNA uridine-5-carboxymethylaminomethyl(34) synthesis enzyme MnmG [Planctomycetota bacterium]|jgi:tRNA uridine 5-carboxymethylaminomethyl modification enzyme
MRALYDILVVGGGHAGTEAARAAVAALERDAAPDDGPPRVALVTMDPARIGQMSCNPAIGGLAKGQMVREIDALGGLMGRAIDATGIMFKMLNTSKGAAVRGPRAQADKYAYAAEIQSGLASRTGIDVIAGTVDEILVERGCVTGIVVSAGAGVVRPCPHRIDQHLDPDRPSEAVFASRPEPAERSGQPRVIRGRAIVLTTGTFMRGLMHTGETRTPGGRVGEGAAAGLSLVLRRLGFELGRLKTGTPPRLTRTSIDWDGLDPQHGDARPRPFSDLTEDASSGVFPRLEQVECRVTQTTAAAHDVIRANLHRAPMYSGQIEAASGPRYCPSIEDKVVRFADRTSHHVFLEPESLHTNEVYCNGISTSLPIDVQEQVVRAMPGCAHADVLRWGYAVEYDMVWPHQIDATGMTKSVAGLFLAGQINGTTGYEEAGGQGLIAGLNAARFVRSDDLVRLGRDEAYIGVMMDDLVTKTPREPYRMFTSRAEHRLLLRADNADARLTSRGRELGLVDDARWRAWRERARRLDRIRDQFDRVLVEGRPLREQARRPRVTLEEIVSRLPESWPRTLVERVMTETRYEGYIARQRAEVRRQSEADGRGIPGWVEYASITGLRAEAAEVLERFRPATMGQAARLAGVNPADLTLVSVSIRRGRPEAAV